VTKYHITSQGKFKSGVETVIQICDAEDIRILKGSVSKDRSYIRENPPRPSHGRDCSLPQRSYFKAAATEYQGCRNDTGANVAVAMEPGYQVSDGGDVTDIIAIPPNADNDNFLLE